MVLGKQSKNNVYPSKIEVGEIDTSSPFESVKHAVSLFGAVAFTRKRAQPFRKKPQIHSSETVSAKESRLHLAEKELIKLKENLHKTDVIRKDALAELEKAKITIKELGRELSVVSKSNAAVLKETEELGNGNGKWDMDTFRVQYLAAALELNAAKQELGKLHHDYDSASRSYNSVLRQSSEAVAASRASNEAAIELSGKILRMKELVEQATHASEQAEEEKSRIDASRDILRHEYNIKLVASAKTLEHMKRDIDRGTTEKQKQLESISDLSGALKKDVDKAKDSYSESTRMLALELYKAKATLQTLTDEESFLRRLIESLKMELVNMQKELVELNDKEIEAKHLAEDLEAELQTSKSELEKCMIEESIVRSTCDEMKATLVDLSTVTHSGRQEANDITLETESVMTEVKANRNLIKEYEVKLQLLVQGIEAARSAETEALERIKILSENKDSDAIITLSKEEFNSLSVKIKDSAVLSDMKVSIAMVQFESAKARQNDGQNMLEERQKELEELKLATAEALEMAGEAEAGKNKLEGELQKLIQCLHLHNKAEGVSNSRTDSEIEMEHLPYQEGINRSYSTSSANRRRVTLGDILKLDREEGKRPKES
ncbi:unnamed protein product [Rhodiola kirilowii]